jgi:hypothetical protein
VICSLLRGDRTRSHLELIAIDVSGAIVLTGRSLGWAHVFDEDNHKHA